MSIVRHTFNTVIISALANLATMLGACMVSVVLSSVLCFMTENQKEKMDLKIICSPHARGEAA